MKKYFVLFIMLLFFVDIVSGYTVYYNLDNNVHGSYYDDYYDGLYSVYYDKDYDCEKVSYSESRCYKKVKNDVVYVNKPYYDRLNFHDYIYIIDWNDSREEKLKRWDEERQDRLLIREERSEMWKEERDWRGELREQRIFDMEANRLWEKERREQIILDWEQRRRLRENN